MTIPSIESIILASIHNEMTQALLLLAILSTASVLLTRLSKLLWRHFMRQISTTVFINGTDPNYSTFKLWLDKNNMARNSRNLMLSHVTLSSTRAHNMVCKEALFSFGRGNHWLFLNNTLTKLTFHQTELNNGDLGEAVSVTMFTRSKNKMFDLFNNSYEQARDDDRLRVLMHSTHWRTVVGVAKRKLDSYFSEDGVEKDIVEDCRQFLQRENFYRERGLPYRRGYLFYGKPGTGKTSLISVLASEVQLPLYILPLGNMASDKDLVNAITDVPPGAILVLEDIDSHPVSHSRELRPITPANNADNAPKLSLSALLNAIDGLNSGNRRIVIMTSNHPEKLDPALVRPGRIDVKREIKLLSHKRVLEYLRHFYGDIDTGLLDADIHIACSQLQSLCLVHDKHSVIDALNESCTKDESKMAYARIA